jgi:hypothetical protein
MPNPPAIETFGTKLNTLRQIRAFGTALKGGVHDDSPGPCPGCARAVHCGAEALACEAFALFVRFGGRDRWKIAPRQPGADIYRRMFGRSWSTEQDGPSGADCAEAG